MVDVFGSVALALNQTLNEAIQKEVGGRSLARRKPANGRLPIYRFTISTVATERSVPRLDPTLPSLFR